MEENEEKVLSSIGSKDEITEPHVKQIISAFDGKKFLAEDIDKFKQLEKTFREILQLDDGENVINKLTGDITKMITSGVAIQLNNGTVSIGQVATIVLNMSADRLKESIEIEENAKKERANAAQAEADAMTNKKTTANEINGFESKEEFDKFNDDLINLFEALGVKLSDEDKKEIKSELDNLYARSNERDENGNIVDEGAYKAAGALKLMQENPTRENYLKGFDILIEYYENEIKNNEIALDEVRKGKKRELTPEEFEQRINLCKRMIARYRKEKEALLAHEECEPEEVIGKSAEVIQKLLEVKKEQAGLDSEKDKEAFAMLRTRGTKIIQSQETVFIDMRIEEYQSILERIIKKMEDASEEEKPKLKDQYRAFYGKLCIQLSQKEKLEGYLSEKDKRYEQKEFKRKKTSKLVNLAEKEGDIISRTDIALKHARKINDMYNDKNGSISTSERQAYFYGKKVQLLADKNISQVAVESLVDQFERISKKLFDLISNSSSEQGKMIIFRQYIKAKTAFSIQLQKLNITTEYRKEIMSQFTISEGIVDPEELQLLTWKYSLEKVKENGGSTQKIEEMMGRLERNKGVFSEAMKPILEDPEKRERYAEILEAFRMIIKPNNISYQDLKDASTESEVMKLFSDAFDKNFGAKEQNDSSVKKHFEDILKNIYDKNGKDGLITLFENRPTFRDYINRVDKSIRKLNIEKEVYENLGEEDRVVFGRVADDGKTIEGEWPEFLTDNSKMYLEVMLALRKQLYSEEEITQTLLQLDPEAVRNAYLMYELIENKKLLENPQIGEEEKEALEDRNKEIIEMKYQLYVQKIKQQMKQYGNISRNSTDGEYKKYYEQQEKKSKELLAIASKQKKDFDITQVQITMPDEEVTNELYLKESQQFRNKTYKIKGFLNSTTDLEHDRKVLSKKSHPTTQTAKYIQYVREMQRRNEEKSKKTAGTIDSQKGASVGTIKLSDVVGKTQGLPLGEINRTTKETNGLRRQEIEKNEEGKTSEASIEDMSV